MAPGSAEVEPGQPGVEAEAGWAEVATDDELFARIYTELRRFAAVVAPVEVDPDDNVMDIDDPMNVAEDPDDPRQPGPAFPADCREG